MKIDLKDEKKLLKIVQKFYKILWNVPKNDQKSCENVEKYVKNGWNLIKMGKKSSKMMNKREKMLKNAWKFTSYKKIVEFIENFLQVWQK